MLLKESYLDDICMSKQFVLLLCDVIWRLLWHVACVFAEKCVTRWSLSQVDRRERAEHLSGPPEEPVPGSLLFTAISATLTWTRQEPHSGTGPWRIISYY